MSAQDLQQPNRNRAIGISFIAVSALVALAGCWTPGVLVGRDKFENSPAYVSEERVHAIVGEAYTRDQVIAALGPADAHNDETRALGFLRCFDSHGRYVGVLFVYIYPVFPIYGAKRDVTKCEFIAVHFDVNGRAVRAARRFVLDSPKVVIRPEVPPPQPFQARKVMCDMLGSSGQCIFTPRIEPAFPLPHCEEDSCLWLYGYYANAVELADSNEPQNYVEAYKMFSIVVAIATDATLADDAIKAREALAAKMDAVQLSEARRLAEEWTTAFEKR